MTRESNTRSRSAHEHAWQLLPWFVTGRLSNDDAQRIERHLETCAECRAELEAQRELAAAFRRDDPVMLAPQASLQKLLARVDRSVPESSEVIPTRKPRSPQWFAIAAAVPAFAIGASFVLLWQQFDDRLHAPRFTTLTNSSVASAGPTLRVVFRPETRTDALQRVVRSIDAQIVAGPTEAGVYTLRLTQSMSEQRLAATLTRVRGEREVLFAEHVLERSQ